MSSSTLGDPPPHPTSPPHFLSSPNMPLSLLPKPVPCVLLFRTVALLHARWTLPFPLPSLLDSLSLSTGGGCPWHLALVSERFLVQSRALFPCSLRLGCWFRVWHHASAPSTTPGRQGLWWRVTPGAVHWPQESGSGIAISVFLFIFFFRVLEPQPIVLRNYT